MNETLSPTARGFISGLVVLAIGLSASICRFVMSNAKTDSLFFISLFFTFGGVAVLIQTIAVARRRNTSAS